ncbi:hypothetical protein GCM10009795_025070 [Nocardioides hankookensis]|uniref:YdeI/OmpD-associated family protein n=1 Tax=Nocardioides hankookensis TaxID=443157 RepID=A0ABW1LDI0_9ACTN
MRLTLELESTGGNTAGFRIPDEVVDELGAGRRPKVAATVGEHTWRSSIARMGDAFWLGMSNENRDLAGVEAGQVLDLDVVVDDAPRTVDLPEELAPVADAWARLSYSNQRRIAEGIESAKKPETRAARVEKALAELS